MVTKFLNISTDSKLSNNSNILVPSEKAVRAFVASKAIQVDFVQQIEPETHTPNQKWLNTSDNKLYTAISSSDWGSGESVEKDQFFTYQDLLYYFDGTSIHSYSSLTITETNSDSQIKFWVGTREQYSLINPKDTSTLYYVIENLSDYAVLATQEQFDLNSNDFAATPYQVKQVLGNYLSLTKGGILAAGKTIGLTNTNNQTSTLSYDNNGYIIASNKFNVTNEASVGSLVVRSGNVYKTNTSGATIVWSDGYATTSKAGVVKPDGTTITINDGIISASGAGSLANTATGTNSLTILGSPTSSSNAVNIGLSSTASQNSTSLGYNAKASGQGSIQIGAGNNQIQNTLSVGLNGTNYQLLDANGKIPNARIDFTNTYQREFNSVSVSIASGDAGIAGTYTISSLPNDGKVRLALFQGFLVTSGSGNSTMSLQTDVMDYSCLIASANNQHSGGGGLLLPIKQQVTIGFPSTGGGVVSPTNILFLGYF